MRKPKVDLLEFHTFHLMKEHTKHVKKFYFTDVKPLTFGQFAATVNKILFDKKPVKYDPNLLWSANL